MAKKTADNSNNVSLRIGTFNIAAGLHPDVKQLQLLTVENELDIVALQEVDRHTARNNDDMLQTFAGSTYPYYHYAKAMDFDGGEYGLGLVSKYAILSSEATAAPLMEGMEPRVFQRVLLECNGKKLAIYNVHLSYESAVARQQQMATLQSLIEQDEVEHKVILGDFNTEMGISEYDSFTERYQLANGLKGEWYDTFNAADDSMINKAIDNIIVTSNLAITDVTLVPTTLSDHHLLVVSCQFQ